MTDQPLGPSFDASFKHDTPYLDALLSERLASMGGSGATAGLSFDVASGLDFNEARTLGQAGVPSFARPNAAAQILNGVVDSQMPEVEVPDIRAYQNKLKGLGYLPSDYQVTGQWDSQSASAAYELNQHASNAFKQGNSNPTAISAKNGFALLGATMPSKVFQGLVGAAEGIGKSFAGTAKHAGSAVMDLVHGHLGKAFHEFGWEDALNALTVASMFFGVGDLVEAGRGLFSAADFGGDIASLIAKPAATDLAATAAQEGPSLASKLVGGVVRRFSSGAADNYLDWVAQNGFKAQAERPLLKAAANIYGGLSKMSFFPQAESILIPHSVMGQKVSKAPTLPGAIDWSTLFLNPEVGLTPFRDFGHALAPLSAGILDFTRLAGIREPVDAVSRVAMATQAYAAKNAAEKVLESDKALTGAYRERAFVHAVANEKNAALDIADDGTRQVKPEYAQAAMDWASKNPHAAAAYIKSLQTSAQAREGLGLTGFNPESDYRAGEQIATELTGHLREAQPQLVAARDQLVAVQGRVDELSKAAQGGDHDAFVQLQEAKQELQKAEASVDYQNFGTVAKDADANSKLDSPSTRILAQRADNPRTVQNVRTLLSDWNNATDEGTRDGVRKAMRAMGLGDVPDSQIAEHLNVLQEIAPFDITDSLPAGYREELANHGYKAVLGGDDVFLRSDVNPLSVTLPKYSNIAYYAANLGLSPKAVDPQAVGKLVNATTAQAWDDILSSHDAEKFPVGSGQSVLDDWHGVQAQREKALAKMGHTEGAVQRMMSRAKLNIQNTSISGLRNFLADRWLDDPSDASSLARQLQKATLQANFHPGLVNSPSHALGILDQAAAALRIHGLPGLVEGLRSMTVSDIAKTNLASVAAGLGTAYGAKEAGATGKEQIAAGIAGAVLGQKAGNAVPIAKLRPLGRFADKAWGFLPDNLMRAALAARFTFSPMFEARLLVKGQEIRGMKYNLPMSFAPLKTMTSDGTLDTYSRIWEQATGMGTKELDDATRAMTNAGLFGYNVRNHAILDYGRMYDRLTAADKIRGIDEATAHSNAIDWLKEHGPSINTFGPRSPLEKTVNAFFFPFSFEKKFATVLHDYFTAAPVRTLLAHHALSLADQLDKAPPGQQSKWQQLINNHAPILKEVNKLNALAYGISPGEFGGVFAPLAASLGVAKEALAGAFMPHAVTDDTAKKFSNLLPRVLPAWTAIASLKDELVQTSKGIQGETTPAQVNDYFALKQAIDNKYADYGTLYGTDGTIAGFENSKKVPYDDKLTYQNDIAALHLRFPDGAAYAASLANKSALQQNDIEQLLGQVQLAPVQQAIGRIVQVEALDKTTQRPARSPEQRIEDTQSLIADVRRQALAELQKFGLPFNDLWVRYGFDRTYGPIVTPTDELTAA